MTRHAAIISALLCVLLTALASNAQTTRPFLSEEEVVPPTPTTHPKRAATIEAVRLGWRGHLLADCWGPARVFISGNPQVNNGAFGGTLEVTFTQDGSQSAVIRVPVATTPGRVTPVEVAMALPQNAGQLTLSLLDDNNREVHGRQYWQGNSLPATVVSGTPLVLAVADRGGVAPTVAKVFPAPGLASIGVANNMIEFGQPAPAVNPLDETACVVITSDDLPETWAAYDGVAALVIGADEIAALPTARLAALRDWLQSGGCVVTRVGVTPLGLTKLLEDTPGRVEVGDLRPLTLGAELTQAFAEPLRVEKEGKFIEARASLHERVTARPLRLGESQDPDARSWRVRWAPADATRRNGLETEGLLAEGPVGFGWVVVLGIDPAMLGTGTDDAAARAGWSDALRSPCAELATRSRAVGYSWGERGSGPDRAARIALRSVLNHLSGTPSLGDGAFIIVVLSLIALGIAIGPFDALFLGAKKMRQRSWATALGWIGAASLLAAVVPPLLRGGDSRLRRLRVIDAIASPDGSVDHAWQMAVTTLFAGAGGSVRLSPVNAPAHDSMWFRGVSPLFVQASRTDPLTRFVTLQQAPAGGSSLVAGRSNQLPQGAALQMGQWTFRTMSEHGPVRPDAGLVSVRRDTVSDAWVAEFANPLGTFVDGALRIGDTWHHLSGAQRNEQRTIVRARAAKDPGAWSSRDAIARAENYRDLDFQSGMALELTGARERSRTLDARLASGEWAVLYLRLRDVPASMLCQRLTWAGTGESYKTSEEAVYRVLVPLGENHVERTTWNATLPKTVWPRENPARRNGNITIPPLPPTPPGENPSDGKQPDSEPDDETMIDDPKGPDETPKQEPKP